MRTYKVRVIEYTEPGEGCEVSAESPYRAVEEFALFHDWDFKYPFNGVEVEVTSPEGDKRTFEIEAEATIDYYVLEL